MSPLDVSARVGATCYVVPQALSPARCVALRRRAEALGFVSPSAAYPPSCRTNQRLVLDDEPLAATLEQELAAHLPEAWIDASGRRWPRIGINPRVRFCRYRAGEHFSVHRDGVHHRSEDTRSALTVMVYLDDGFGGGETRFFPSRGARTPSWSFVPQQGTLIVFDHRLWHDGAPVSGGHKTVLRSDILVRRPAGVEDAEDGTHRGYVWGAVACPDGTLITSGRDRTLRRWSESGGGVERWSTGQPSARALAVDEEGNPWTGGRDGTLCRWGPKPSRVRAHDGAVVALVRHGHAMVSGGADGRVVRWGRRRGDVAAHAGWVWALASDGDAVWSAGEDGELQRSGAVVFRARSPLRSLVRLGPSEVAVGGADGVVRMVRRGRVAWRRRAHAGAVTALAMLADGTLASGGEDGRVFLWRGEQLHELRRHDDFVTGIACLGERIVTTGYDGIRGFGPCTTETDIAEGKQTPEG